jgi:hypothetical protein
MWRWFGFKDGSESTGYGAEVLQANWIPPQPQAPVIAGASAPATEETPDIAAFLARVYANQEC